MRNFSMPDSLGDKIKKLRKQEKLTLDKLAKLSGISKGYLCELEKGTGTNPTIEKLKSITYALNTTLDYFLGTEERELQIFLLKFNKLSSSDKIKIMQII